MARQRRFSIDNGIYHIFSRGNNRMKIFHTDEDYEAFLAILRNNKKKYGFRLYHYALMDNHYHIVIWCEKGETLSKLMKRINLMYVQYYRKKHGGIGHFFQDRFKSHIIEKGSYLLQCGYYVEMNPVKAGIVAEPEEYRWTSYYYRMNDNADGLVDLACDQDDGQVGIIAWERRNENRYFRSGCWGSKIYFQMLVSTRGLRPVWSHPGRPRMRC